MTAEAVQNQRVLEALFRVEAMSKDMGDIKDAMKDMAKAIERLAVIEERQSAASAAIGRAFTELDKHDKRITEIEKAQPLQQQSSDWMQRAVWAIVTAVATAIGSLVIVKNAEPQKAPPALIAPR